MKFPIFPQKDNLTKPTIINLCNSSISAAYLNNSKKIQYVISKLYGYRSSQNLRLYLRLQFREFVGSTSKSSEHEQLYEPTVLIQVCMHSWPVTHSSMSEKILFEKLYINAIHPQNELHNIIMKGNGN